MECDISNGLTYLVDDEFSIRDSLTLLIKSTGRNVKSFDSAEAFLNEYKPRQPSCLILDVRMPLMSGLELQEELSIRNISIPIIFISGNADIPDSAKAFRAGALDFLEKPFDNQTLLERIDEALRKDVEVKRQLLHKQKIQECLNRLTVREKEVLNLIVNSYSNKEVARILNVSYRTIDAHRSSLMKKMEAENVTTLVSMVMSL